MVGVLGRENWGDRQVFGWGSGRVDRTSFSGYKCGDDGMAAVVYISNQSVASDFAGVAAGDVGFNGIFYPHAAPLVGQFFAAKCMATDFIWAGVGVDFTGGSVWGVACD